MPRGRTSQERITAYVVGQITSGRVRDRTTLLEVLQARGFTITCKGADFVTVCDPRMGKPGTAHLAALHRCDRLRFDQAPVNGTA